MTNSKGNRDLYRNHGLPTLPIRIERDNTTDPLFPGLGPDGCFRAVWRDGIRWE
jgi:hypothetical protein